MDREILTSSPEEGLRIALERVKRFQTDRSRQGTLFLAQLGLKEIPEQVFDLKDVETLDLSFNRLSDLPHSISQLTNLRVLWLYENDFEQFPVSITSLRNLEKLYFGNNRLSRLPAAIGKLVRLRELRLGLNRIVELPPEIRRLGRLELLQLIENPIEKRFEALGRIERQKIEDQSYAEFLRVSVLKLLESFDAQAIMDYYFEHNPPMTIFLSYARIDKHEVDNIRSLLLSYGYPAWMDVHNIVGGESWQRAISKAISTCDVFIPVLSYNSVNRRGMVQKELRLALDKLQGMLASDIYVIPLRLDTSPIPETLENLQAIDWDQGKGAEALISSLEVALQRRMENM